MSNIIQNKISSGKILIVDDTFSDVEDLILKLLHDNIPVQYWDSQSDLKYPLTNVRILILDLKLTDAQGEKSMDNYFVPAVEVLHKIKGPYVLIILSTDYDEGDMCRLKDTYKRIYDVPPIIFEDEIGINKKIELDELYNKIRKKFENEDVFKLILSWEMLLDVAKDNILHTISNKDVENEITEFIKSIAIDVGNKSLAKEFVLDMTRFLSRYMNSGAEYENLSLILNKINEKPNPEHTCHSLFAYMRTYYIPNENEQNWTGDIIELKSVDTSFPINNNKKFWKYGIILNPACDFSQNKVDNIIICGGFAIDESIFEDNHPINNTVKDILKHNTRDKIIDNNFNKLLTNSKFKTLRYHILKNFKVDKTNLNLCFDFQRINSIKASTFDDQYNIRLGRLDSPYIEKMQQDYGNYSTRLGIPSEKTNK